MWSNYNVNHQNKRIPQMLFPFSFVLEGLQVCHSIQDPYTFRSQQILYYFIQLLSCLAVAKMTMPKAAHKIGRMHNSQENNIKNNFIKHKKQTEK